MTGSWSGSDRRKRLPDNWPAVCRQVLAEEPTCYLCRRDPSTEVDHKRRGDDHRRENLGGVCSPCHRLKSAREGNQARKPQEKEARRSPPHPGMI